MEKIGPISYELINQEVKTIDHYHWDRINLFEKGMQMIDGQVIREGMFPFAEENKKHWERVQFVTQQNYWYLDEDEYFSALWANSHREDLLSKFSETDMDYFYLRDVLTALDGLDRDHAQMGEELKKLCDNWSLLSNGLVEEEDVGEMLEIYKGLISAHRVEVDYYRKR